MKRCKCGKCSPCVKRIEKAAAKRGRRASLILAVKPTRYRVTWTVCARCEAIPCECA